MPLFEIVIWFPGPMAVMVVPIGMPVPVITCPTMRPEVLVRLTVLLLATTSAEVKLLLGTMDVIVAPSGIPGPAIIWPKNNPDALVTGRTSLPAVTGTVEIFVLVCEPSREMPDPLEPLVKRKPAAFRTVGDVIVPRFTVCELVPFIEPKAAMSAPELFQVVRLVMLFVAVLSGATEVKLLPVCVHGLVA